jgi:hypothetical protein
MGGNVFMRSMAEGYPRLSTPRMPFSDYLFLRRDYETLLKKAFPNAASVVTAIEAPGKEDYGDIDIIVFDDGESDWARVAATVGAVAWVNRGTDAKPLCSLAVHRSRGRYASRPPVKYALTTDNDPLQRKPSSEVDETPYAQIDVSVVKPALKDWTIFHTSYGDLTGILGMIVTNFGFDITDTGLRLRLQEWDDSSLPEWEHSKPRLDEGKIILSTDPNKTMEFFGLNLQRYHAGIRTVEDLFKWLCECRMVSRHSLKREKKIPVMREERKTDRDMFNTFMNGWLPEHLKAKGIDISADAEANPLLSQLRQQYLTEALEFFDRKAAYNKIHRTIVQRRGIETATSKLRPLLAIHSRKKDKALNELLRAFRRNVAYVDGKPLILAQARSDTNSQLHTFLNHSGTELQDPEGIEAWVKVNFDSVKKVEREREKKRASVVEDLNVLHARICELAVTYAPGGAGYVCELEGQQKDAEIVKLMMKYDWAVENLKRGK